MVNGLIFYDRKDLRRLGSLGAETGINRQPLFVFCLWREGISVKMRRESRHKRNFAQIYEQL